MDSRLREFLKSFYFILLLDDNMSENRHCISLTPSCTCFPHFNIFEIGMCFIISGMSQFHGSLFSYT